MTFHLSCDRSRLLASPFAKPYKIALDDRSLQICFFDSEY
jgi:hypothetical protein